MKTVVTSTAPWTPIAPIQKKRAALKLFPAELAQNPTAWSILIDALAGKLSWAELQSLATAVRVELTPEGGKEGGAQQFDSNGPAPLDASVSDHRFTEVELRLVFKGFLDRLEKELGNDREAMYKFHLKKLEGLTLSEVLHKMPRGPKGRWQDMMFEIRDHLKEIAEEHPTTGASIEQAVAVNPALDALCALLWSFTSGSNYTTQNPYTRPEVKQALQVLRKATGENGAGFDSTYLEEWKKRTGKTTEESANSAKDPAVGAPKLTGPMDGSDRAVEILQNNGPLSEEAVSRLAGWAEEQGIELDWSDADEDIPGLVWVDRDGAAWLQKCVPLLAESYPDSEFTIKNLF